jgi:hypothetical protein
VANTGLDQKAIDRSFALEAYIAGSPCEFDLIAAEPAPELRGQLASWQNAVALPDHDVLRLTFSHGRCDALGALAAVRCLLAGRPVDRTPSPGMGRDRTKPPARRAMDRLRRPPARILPSSREGGDTIMALFDLRPSAGRIGTVTEACVIACHEVALARAQQAHGCSTVLVSVSGHPWSERRSARNCSSGFLSTFTAGSRGLRQQVLAEMTLARGSRGALLKRIERYGRMPRALWPVARALSRLTPGGSNVSAIVSSLGWIDDPLLAAAAGAWYFVPPTRHVDSLSFGLIEIGEGVTAGIRGKGTRASVVGAAQEVLELAKLKPTISGVLAERAG